MLTVFSFIFSCIADVLVMLFNINVGFTNLGMLMCTLFIIMPTIISFVCLLRNQELFYQISEYRKDLHARYDYRAKHTYKGAHEKPIYKGKHVYNERKERDN